VRVTVLAVGRPRGAIADAIADYESRVKRYHAFAAVEVKEEPFRGEGDAARVREAEGKRLLERVPAGAEVIALHETGSQWSSLHLAERLREMALHASPGAAFLIGGAYGLGDAVLARAKTRLSLGPMTLTHEMARLVLTEQLYRAGTIERGEPYHKARD
jgi:23S rRNA (pseudouridine1915-N3)-methyltransferase